MAGPWEAFSTSEPAATPAAAGPWAAFANQDKPAERGVVDKLLGQTGPRTQLWPERAVRDLISLPEKTITAATSAPAGSREATEAMVAPAAETALATLGSLGAGRSSAIPKASPEVVAPSVTELKTAARAGYQHPDVAAVELSPQSTAGLSAKIENDLAQRGFRPANEPAVFSAVKELTPPTGVTSVRVADIDSARKVLGNIAKERDAVGAPTPRAAAANVAIDHINDYLPNIGKTDVIAGDPVRASEILKDASGNWGAAKRGEQVDLQLTRADRQAAKSGMGGNVENAMRQKIATILDNPKRTVGFSAAERQAMEDIVRGTGGRNALRAAGKLGVDGGLSMMLNMGAAIGSGGTTIPITAAGTMARVLGQRATARAGAGLSDMVRSRSPLATGNQGMAAVQQALLPAGPAAASATSIPYAAILSALLQQQQHQGAR